MTELRDQPGWVQKLHQLNDILHKEPYDTLAYGFFWYLVLLISAPLCSFGMLFYTAYKLALFYRFNKKILPNEHPDKELAVVITGCDSGFGSELVFSLISKGFVVFAACLKKESFEQFQAEPKIIPVQVNVTSDKDVEDLSKTVSKWLSEGGDKDKKRCLHALVNNAGVGAAGLSDWLQIKDFQACMDVNFLGTIRVTKAFMPLLRKQAANGSYTHARIVNMVSTAGLFAGGIITTAYEASKHACDCFTTNLRLEMKPFGIKVTAVNPGLHKTPLAAGSNIASFLRRTWDALTPEHRAEYGEDYFNGVIGRYESGAVEKFMWDKKYVVEAMDKAVVEMDPPARVLVGLDAKYVLYPWSKLPSSLRVNLIRKKPAIMSP